MIAHSIDIDFLSPKKAEVINVDFRDLSEAKKKKLIIFYPGGEVEEREVFKRPTFAEMMAIVGGFPARASVRHDGQTRTLIYNADGFKKPYKLNEKATDLRSMAKIDPRAQIWGPAILVIGWRFSKI